MNKLSGNPLANLAALGLGGLTGTGGGGSMNASGTFRFIDILAAPALKRRKLNIYINPLIIFRDVKGINNLFSNGKQIHLDYARWIFESENNKILNKNILLVDDDLRNLQIANKNGHCTFQVTSSTQLKDFLNYLKNLKF